MFNVKAAMATTAAAILLSASPAQAAASWKCFLAIDSGVGVTIFVETFRDQRECNRFGSRMVQVVRELRSTQESAVPNAAFACIQVRE